MINSTMPVASPLSAMLEVDSPTFLQDSPKNFFDYAAEETDEAASFYAMDYLDTKAQGGLSPQGGAGLGVTALLDSDLIPVEAMEDVYLTPDTAGGGGGCGGGGGECGGGDQMVVSVVGGEEVEEVEEVVVGGMEVVLGASPSIPTTALELVMEDGERLELLTHLPAGAGISFLNATLPAPLGSQCPSSCPPPSTPGPFPSPTYPPPPSTPSCYSTCSDTSSSLSDVSTPGLSGVTSGDRFVIPLPADDKMAAATLTALETCSLTPLIKEELKYTIQSRRLALGKPELVVDTSPPVRVKKVMTAEERERALKRREQNRMAAQRFRQKQKDTADVLLKKCHKLEGSNTTLRTEIRRLARESQELRQLLTSHLLICPKVKVAR